MCLAVCSVCPCIFSDAYEGRERANMLHGTHDGPVGGCVFRVWVFAWLQAGIQLYAVWEIWEFQDQAEWRGSPQRFWSSVWSSK